MPGWSTPLCSGNEFRDERTRIASYALLAVVTGPRWPTRGAVGRNGTLVNNFFKDAAPALGSGP